MIEVKLKRKEEDPKKKETAKDGVIDTYRAVLIGKDKDNLVDWTVTLKCEGTELPNDYRKAMGKHWTDEIFATLSGGAQQTQLD